MSDLIPVAIFAACILGTLLLVRMCDWLNGAGPEAGPRTAAHGREEDGR